MASKPLGRPSPPGLMREVRANRCIPIERRCLERMTGATFLRYHNLSREDKLAAVRSAVGKRSERYGQYQAEYQQSGDEPWNFQKPFPVGTHPSLLWIGSRFGATKYLVITKILFVCTGNSARSQFAEAFARYYAGDMVQVASAGTSPAGLNPNAIRAMNEVGIDIRHHTSDPLSAFRIGDFDCVVTLCGDARDNCPPLPQDVCREHWSIPDPAKSQGAPFEVLKAFRVVRHQVERRVKALLERELIKC